jgi:hypothetical protein
LNSPLKSVSAGIVSIWYWRAAIHKLSPIAQTLLLNVAIVGVTLCASVRGNRVTLRMGRKR